jgi:hypothetical protein
MNNPENELMVIRTFPMMLVLVALLLSAPAWAAIEDARFGTSSALLGNTLVVGAPNDALDADRKIQGAVYVFKRSSPSSAWRLSQRLVGGPGATFLGSSKLALSRRHLIIGAPVTNQVFAFYRSNESEDFAPNTQMSSTAAAAEFGHSLAMVEGSDGKAVLVIGLPGFAGQMGAAEVWEASDASWVPRFTKTSTIAGSRFGASVAVGLSPSGTHLVIVGQPGYDSDTGRVHQFEWTGSELNQFGTLNNGGTGLFGWEVALAGDTLLIAEKWEPAGGLNRGRVHVYTGSFPLWTHRDALPHATDPGAQRDDSRWGNKIAISELPGGKKLVLVASSPGGLDPPEAYRVHVYEGAGATWTKVHSIIDSPPTEETGDSLAASPSDVIVGVPRADGRFIRQGRVDLRARKLDSAGNVVFEPVPSLYGYAAPELSLTAGTLTIVEDSSGGVSFQVDDADSVVDELRLEPTTDRSELVPSLSVQQDGNTRNFELRVSPAADANGAGIVTLSASDLEGTTGAASIPVTVIAVNDAPSFKLQANPEHLPFASVQQVNDMLHSFSGGPADESSQTLLIVQSTVSDPNDVIKDEHRLDDVRLVRDSSGASADAFYELTGNEGTAQVTVRAFDTGGTANGGLDSAVGTFQIVVGRPGGGALLRDGFED